MLDIENKVRQTLKKKLKSPMILSSKIKVNKLFSVKHRIINIVGF